MKKIFISGMNSFRCPCLSKTNNFRTLTKSIFQNSELSLMLEIVLKEILQKKLSSFFVLYILRIREYERDQNNRFRMK